MANPLSMKSWSPYVAGAGIGLLSWFAWGNYGYTIEPFGARRRSPLVCPILKGIPLCP